MIEVATADIAARPSPSRDLAMDLTMDLATVAPAPAVEPQVRRWPGAVRMLILVGGAGGLWAGIGWVALQAFR
jgi:hypothetical protein